MVNFESEAKETVSSGPQRNALRSIVAAVVAFGAVSAAKAVELPEKKPERSGVVTPGALSKQGLGASSKQFERHTQAGKTAEVADQKALIELALGNLPEMMPVTNQSILTDLLQLLKNQGFIAYQKLESSNIEQGGTMAWNFTVTDANGTEKQMVIELGPFAELEKNQFSVSTKKIVETLLAELLDPGAVELLKKPEVEGKILDHFVNPGILEAPVEETCLKRGYVWNTKKYGKWSLSEVELSADNTKIKFKEDSGSGVEIIDIGSDKTSKEDCVQLIVHYLITNGFVVPK